MQKLRHLFLILVAACHFTNGHSQSTDSHLAHLGLIGELSYYKVAAENHAIRIFNHKSLPDSVKSEVITRYNKVRSGYEQLVLQLISDLHAKKRLWYFKNLDRYFYYGKIKKRKKVHFFVENWIQLMGTYEDFITYPTEDYLDDVTGAYPYLYENEAILQEDEITPVQSGLKINPLDPVGSASSLFRIYKNISMKNALRTNNITSMLYGLRLRNAAELIAEDNESVKFELEDKK